MNQRLLDVAFTIGCLAVMPSPLLAGGAQRGGATQANTNPPHLPVASQIGTVRPTTPGGTPRPTRSRTGRRVGVIAAVPYPVYLDERSSDIPDTTQLAPPTSPSAEPSSIQPLLPSASSQLSLHGNLWLAVGPNTAQVYVDGFYVGTVEESDRSPAGLNLAPGWHRLELRAPGFETPAINVTIEANRTTSYQGNLKPTRP